MVTPKTHKILILQKLDSHFFLTPPPLPPILKFKILTNPPPPPPKKKMDQAYVYMEISEYPAHPLGLLLSFHWSNVSPVHAQQVASERANLHSFKIVQTASPRDCSMTIAVVAESRGARTTAQQHRAYNRL